MNHKVGQKVKIISSIYGHEFLIGETVAITKIEVDDSYMAENAIGSRWWITDAECEALPSMIDELQKRINVVEAALKMSRQYVFAWQVRDIQPLLGENLEADLQRIDDLLKDA